MNSRATTLAATVVDEDAASANVVTHEVTSSIMAVSSQTAARWLADHNTHNVKLREEIALRYQEDMEAGLWLFDGAPIRFSTDGVLRDGQHRLTALANCVPPLTLPMLVVRGLPPESQAVMDQGRKRTSGDQLGLNGVANANNVASAVKFYLVYERGMLFRDRTIWRRITGPQISAWVAENPEHVAQFNTVCSLVRRTGGAPSVVGGFALYMVVNGLADYVTAFLGLLACRSNMDMNHPIMVLDNRFRRLQRDGIKVTQREVLGALIQAWNHWLQGHRVQKLQAPKGGYTEENFPVPLLRARKSEELELDLERGIELAGVKF